MHEELWTHRLHSVQQCCRYQSHERVKSDLGRTCHNDKPGLNDGDDGEIDMRMRERSWLESGTCHNDKPGYVCEKIEKGGVMERKK